MRSPFPLFRSHLDLAHHWWRHHLEKGEKEKVVIDATCGNGHDTLTLAQLVIPAQGSVTPLLHAIDIQYEALISAQQRVEQSLTVDQLNSIAWHRQSHKTLPCADNSVKLIVYNLGYLPGGDKTLTTQTTSTLESLCDAQRVLMHGGMISVTCYPGHPEGSLEEQAIKEWSRSLEPSEWNVTWHQFTNRKSAPSLLFIQKKLVI